VPLLKIWFWSNVISVDAKIKKGCVYEQSLFMVDAKLFTFLIGQAALFWSNVIHDRYKTIAREPPVVALFWSNVIHDRYKTSNCLAITL